LIEETLKNSLARWLKMSSLALDGVLGKANQSLVEADAGIIVRRNHVPE
jgi:hypothetical protein